jgi:ribosome-binding protein aMBF1 (putative translation factor)
VLASHGSDACNRGFESSSYDQGSVATHRAEVTELIVAARHRKGLKWSEIAAEVGAGKEWITAAASGRVERHQPTLRFSS